MKFVRLAVVLLALVTLSACSSSDEHADEFGAWAGTLEYVASVDASPGPDGGGMTAHLVVDGAIPNADLVSLVDSLRGRAADESIAPAAINLIVGNAWGFSTDDAGVNVSTINQLRDDPLFVGATIWYQPLDAAPTYVGGLRGTVGSQAGLRDAPVALTAAYTSNGGDLDGVPVTVSTADGRFSIAGIGDAQPDAAITLWQAISGRVLPTAGAAAVDSSGESLTLTVGTAEEKATAEAIGAQFPDVKLTVTL